MIKKEKILQSYIYNIVDDEQAEKITIITKEDLSRFIKRLEKTSIENINVKPSVNKDSFNNCDIFFLLDDIKVSETDLGIIKNLLSQKIVIFGSR